MDFAEISFLAFDGAIARLTLNQPQKVNALSTRIISELSEACAIIT